MKKLYVQQLPCFLAACLLLQTASWAQTATTVYTPKGTAVSAIKYPELTASEITKANNDAAAAFPYAQRLADASRQYNCHAYAWYIPSGPYNYYSWVWINTPGDDTFWQDGSYIEICNESEAAKISYASDDHSAIRSATAGKYDSKWGQWPVMRHDPTDTPYNSSVRKYYVSTQITTSYPSCGSATYSVPAFTGGTYA